VDVVIGNPGEHIGDPGLRIDAGRLCRHPNYAELSGFPHYP
jgi:hypothetical protein